MQKDPYLVLGLKPDATQAEVEEAYSSLRKKYAELRFSEGEEGARAARMLDEIEAAYRDCLEDLGRRVSIDDFGSRLGSVESLIKENRLDDAQRELDAIEPRDAEWHYVQAIIYYKRNWHIESKNQVEIAMALDSGNEKYRRTYEKLVARINGAQAAQGAPGYGYGNAGQQGRGGYNRPEYSRADNANACCNTCSTLICCDCCCECMGGDLIPCC